MKNLVLAITGASGAPYAVRLLDVLLTAGHHVHLTISSAAARVFQEELGISLDLDNVNVDQIRNPHWKSSLADLKSAHASSIFTDSEIIRGKVTYHHSRDYAASIASGSYPTDGMVICPCSMGTLASVANGLSTNLIHRAADVHLKERRKLIVVPRETPLGSIQLQNMKTLADAGAVILPAMPGFYHQPKTIEELVDFVVGRICDQLGLGIQLTRRWGVPELE